MRDYFISFGNVKGNLGVVCTTSTSAKKALFRVSSLGLNPGGEAAIFPISKEEADKLGRDKILSRDVLNAHGYFSTRQQEITGSRYDEAMSHAVKVCKDCNNIFAA